MSENPPYPCSPYKETLGLVYFARMVDKIRLHAAGRLAPEYVENLGGGPGSSLFDARCCRFLGIRYDDLVKYVLDHPEAGDEAVLEWAFSNGRRPSEEEIEIWNAFMMKRGWRDAAVERLAFRLRERGFPLDGSIATMFDYIDADEGRPPHRFPGLEG